MAAAALTGGKVGVAAVGRPLAVPVAQGGQLLEGGVAAALADIVGVLTNFRAGRRLCLVVHQIMVQGGNFRVGGVIAALALASFVGIPADLCAGGRFRGMVYQIVVVGIPIAPRDGQLIVAVGAYHVVYFRRNAGGLGLRIL